MAKKKLTKEEKIKKRREKAQKGLEETRKEFKGEGSLVAGKGDKFECIVCKHPIKLGQTYRRLMPDAKFTEWRYYHFPDCGPGTEAWFTFHPSRLAQLMMEGKEVKREKLLSRREKRMRRKKQLSLFGEKGEIPMSKKAEKTEKKAPGKKGEHLIPMKPVVVPDSVIRKQPKEVQELLKKLSNLKERSSTEGTIIRKALRKAGFKLSDYREKK